MQDFWAEEVDCAFLSRVRSLRRHGHIPVALHGMNGSDRPQIVPADEAAAVVDQLSQGVGRFLLANATTPENAPPLFWFDWRIGPEQITVNFGYVADGRPVCGLMMRLDLEAHSVTGCSYEGAVETYAGQW